MKIYLMAHGNQERWRQDDNYIGPSKHLLGVAGEPLLARTVRILHEFHEEDITIIGPHHYAALCGAPAVTLYDPGPLLSGVLQAYHPDPRVAFLLGDVLFSYDALRTILTCKEGLMFFGRLRPSTVSTKTAQELFGFVCDSLNWSTVEAHCKWMIQRGQKLYYPPKLWALYRLCSGFEHHEHAINPSTIIEINDYTDDIDSGAEYDEFFFPMLCAAIRDSI